ncbi:MAG: phosphotransacetylase family protein [Anaerolineae bacterium]
MKALYITSGETFSGKSALSAGLSMRFRKDGLRTGYMKPVVVNCEVREGIPFDEDVSFAKLILEMPEPFDVICPVAMTPARLHQQLRGPEVNYEPKLLEAFAKLAENRDVLVLEGGRSLREGYVAGLPPKKVVDLVNAQVLMVVKWDESLMVDRIMTGQNYFKESLIGAVINEVPRPQLDQVQDLVVPYLTRHGVKVMGVLRKDPLLAAPSVRELADGLNAELLCASECADELVESFLVGAMGADSALTYFRRKANKAVITGGDRTDIQLAALETSTRCLILTGNLYPAPHVLNRAEELCVPILLTSLDTLTTIQIIEGYFDRSRFQQPQKIERFGALLEEYFDFGALYEAMGLR